MSMVGLRSVILLILIIFLYKGYITTRYPLINPIIPLNLILLSLSLSLPLKFLIQDINFAELSQVRLFLQRRFFRELFNALSAQGPVFLYEQFDAGEGHPHDDGHVDEDH